MPSAVPLSAGTIYRLTDTADPQASATIVVHRDGQGFGSVYGEFERINDPVLGPIYIGVPTGVPIFVFQGDGQYARIGPGPNGSGIYEIA